MHNRKKRKYTIYALSFAVLILGIFLISKLFTLSSVLFQVVINKKIELKKEDDHVNLLLLGRGGARHDGPNLTDTIIFASLDTKNKKVTLVSIPRDLWVPQLNSKINAAYADGEEKRKGGGLIEAKSVVSKITGQNIDYGIVIDFSGFVRAVDMIGGVDVKVDRSFDDYEYPAEGKEDDLCGHSEQEIKDYTATESAELELQKYFSCRYEHVHFDAGLNHMDGQTALKFVRSRHATGAEGTDFARSQRQEKVIQAVKDKVFSLDTILNPAKLFGLYDTLKSSIDTNIPTSQFDDFIKLARDMKKAQIKSGVIDIGDENREGLLIHPEISSEYRYEWVLIPALGVQNYAGIQKYINCTVLSNCPTLSPAPTK